MSVTLRLCECVSYGKCKVQGKEGRRIEKAEKEKESGVGKIKKGKEQGRKEQGDTRLSKSRAGGQEPYLRSQDHLGRSSKVQK